MNAVAGSLAAVMMLAFALSIPSSSLALEVLSNSLSPAAPTTDDNITVTVEVDNSSNISKAYLTYCDVDAGLCYPPKEMRYIGAGAFAVDAGRFKAGEWKYNVTFQFKDGNSTFTPDTHFIIKTPGSGGDGDQNNTTDGNDTAPVGSGSPQTMYYIVVGVVIVVAVVAIAVALVMRKKPKEK